jgi:hypothetical protein
MSISKKTKYPKEMELWFNSELYTIRRAFSNRFDMACALIREAKKAQDIKKDDERMHAIRKELQSFSTICAVFEPLDGVCKVFRKQADTAKIEFTEWLAQPDQLNEKDQEEEEEDLQEDDLKESQETAATVPLTQTQSPLLKKRKTNRKK